MNVYKAFKVLKRRVERMHAMPKGKMLKEDREFEDALIQALCSLAFEAGSGDPEEIIHSDEIPRRRKTR